MEIIVLEDKETSKETFETIQVDLDSIEANSVTGSSGGM